MFDYHIEIWLLDDNLYPLNVVSDDIRDKLIAKGIPAEEIAFIHDAKTEKQKAELFEKVRSDLALRTSKYGFTAFLVVLCRQLYACDILSGAF